MEELTKLLREMKEVKNVKIRVDYEKGGDAHAKGTDTGTAVTG